MMLEEKHPDLVHVEIINAWNHTNYVPFDDQKVLEENQAGGVSYLKKVCYDLTKDRPLDGQKGEKNEKAGNAT